MAQKGFPAAFDEAKPQLGLRPLDFERLESFYTNGTLMVDELVRRRAAPHLARFAKVPHHMEALGGARWVRTAHVLYRWAPRCVGAEGRIDEG